MHNVILNKMGRLEDPSNNPRYSAAGKPTKADRIEECRNDEINENCQDTKTSVRF